MGFVLLKPLEGRMISGEERDCVIRETALFPAATLSPVQESELESFLLGLLAPLSGYLGQADYLAVLAQHRLVSGLPWAIPFTLAVGADTAALLAPAGNLLLRDEEGTPLALVSVSEIWQPDLLAEAQHIYKSTDEEHPGVAQLLGSGPFYVAGSVFGIQLPKHSDFAELRLGSGPATATPSRLVFSATHPLPAAQEAALLALAQAQQLPLLFALPAGSDRFEPLPYPARARLYRKMTSRFPGASTLLLPLERLVLSDRELLQRLLVLVNLGCRTLVLDPSLENPAGLELARRFSDELGISLLELPPCEPTSALLFEQLLKGQHDWARFQREDVGQLERMFPARQRQGVVLFFTGLSGAGKSTVAKALFAALGNYDRSVTLLDGDVVRLNLSKGLGFSKEDRDLNIRRIGFVAGLIAKSGGLAICAPIAPYRKTRADVRQTVSRHGRFVEVHVATDLATCEGRDPKGLYARARSGQLKGFTGIDDPYEAPTHPEIRLDTGRLSVPESLEVLIGWLLAEGYLVPET